MIRHLPPEEEPASPPTNATGTSDDDVPKTPTKKRGMKILLKGNIVCTICKQPGHHYKSCPNPFQLNNDVKLKKQKVSHAPEPDPPAEKKADSDSAKKPATKQTTTTDSTSLSTKLPQQPADKEPKALQRSFDWVPVDSSTTVPLPVEKLLSATNAKPSSMSKAPPTTTTTSDKSALPLATANLSALERDQLLYDSLMLAKTNPDAAAKVAALVTGSAATAGTVAGGGGQAVADGRRYYPVCVGEIISSPEGAPEEEKYQVVEVLGKGRYSLVVKANKLTNPQTTTTTTDNETNKQTQQQQQGQTADQYYAIKISCCDEQTKNAATREAAFLKQLQQHDNNNNNKEKDQQQQQQQESNNSNKSTSAIVRYHSSFIHKGYFCLVLECMKMNLRQALKKYTPAPTTPTSSSSTSSEHSEGSRSGSVPHGVPSPAGRTGGGGGGLSMSAIQHCGRCVVRALCQLWDSQIAHCDIKPDNILLSYDTKTIKLADLGTAMRTTELGCVQTSALVSTYYRPPEVILGSTQLSPKIDLWSLACTLFELYTGRVLFSGDGGGRSLLVMQRLLGHVPMSVLGATKTKYRFANNYFWIDVPKNTNQQFKYHWRHSNDGSTQEAVVINKEVSLSQLVGVDPSSNNPKVLLFVDFLKCALQIDPDKRFDPHQAAQHPFLR
eukprot:TRINITY_DN65830_c9_g2_i1.p1 TRINITY_DN65830_c9_g2~~TRINITY_DN65830_c9_g2_i1.p1  ORF type:complete len:667 (-),score=116.97 TRINITY_DN65830_c9_g2_i1:78-2078(-)